LEKGYLETLVAWIAASWARAKSRIDGRVEHLSAPTLDQHSRERSTLTRDALRVGKYQRHCGSRHHGHRQSNGYASRHVPCESETYGLRGDEKSREVTLRVG